MTTYQFKTQKLLQQNEDARSYLASYQVSRVDLIASQKKPQGRESSSELKVLGGTLKMNLCSLLGKHEHNEPPFQRHSIEGCDVNEAESGVLSTILEVIIVLPFCFCCVCTISVSHDCLSKIRRSQSGVVTRQRWYNHSSNAGELDGNISAANPRRNTGLVRKCCSRCRRAPCSDVVSRPHGMVIGKKTQKQQASRGFIDSSPRTNWGCLPESWRTHNGIGMASRRQPALHCSTWTPCHVCSKMTRNPWSAVCKIARSHCTCGAYGSDYLAYRVCRPGDALWNTR